jgi:cellulose synthase/poly-beta-1,6-N-acetylglucosamine synthase-like glycosyltransferase
MYAWFAQIALRLLNMRQTGTRHPTSEQPPAEYPGKRVKEISLIRNDVWPWQGHTESGRRRVVVLIPAHNEEEAIGEALLALASQTAHQLASTTISVIVVADNCTDRTVEIANAQGAYVFETQGNLDKKAGGLNQALESVLPGLDEGDTVLVTDADCTLDQEFIETALLYIGHGFGGVGGTFRGATGSGFVGHLQRNEYARYARDVERLRGKCLVLTGTAAMFSVRTLQQVSAARLEGLLPPGDSRGGVYDTTALTEDNELTFAILHLGYKVISPARCTLVTEVMPTWKALWRQRLRWKRGAVENCFQYGITRITWKYWGRQLMTFLGIWVTALYIGSLAWSFAFTGGMNMQPLWIAVTAVFVAERVITVKKRGWRHQLVAASMYEIFFDFFLQACHTKAFFDAFLRRRAVW